MDVVTASSIPLLAPRYTGIARRRNRPIHPRTFPIIESSASVEGTTAEGVTRRVPIRGTSAPAAINSFSSQAFSSQPEWPQWHDKVVIFFESSQWVEQNFLPTGAMHVQAM